MGLEQDNEVLALYLYSCIAQRFIVRLDKLYPACCGCLISSGMRQLEILHTLDALFEA